MNTPESDAALVTGAGGGIGRAIAIALAASGSKIVVTDRDSEGAEETVRRITEAGNTATAVTADITCPDDILKLVDAAVDAYGVPRVLVNNAGWTETIPFLDTDRSFWNVLVETNLLGPIGVTHEVLKRMVEARLSAGRVIFVTSESGRVGTGGEAVYAAAEGGLVGFAKSIAREMARYDITVNCVSPGPTNTRLFTALKDRKKDALLRLIPFRRIGEPEDVAPAVAFFASRGAGFITGQVVSVSGGLTMVD